MGQLLYTVVCRFYTINGIIELDMYEVLKRLRINDIRDYDRMIVHHVYTGQAVEYVIKKVLRKVKNDKMSRQLYSKEDPHFLAYDGYFDLKEVSNMNNRSIYLRITMNEKEFYKIYGGKK